MYSIFTNFKDQNHFLNYMLGMTAWNSFFTLKRKLEFTDNFASHFIGRGLTSRSESWIQLCSNTVHYHFGFSSPGSRFKSAIRYQNSLQSTQIMMLFEAVKGRILHHKGLRGLCTAYSLRSWRYYNRTRNEVLTAEPTIERRQNFISRPPTIPPATQATLLN